MKMILEITLGAVFFATLFVAGIFIYIAQPTNTANQQSSQSVEPARLKAHVLALSRDFHPRNYKNLKNLERTAAYIQDQFSLAGAEVEVQEFTVDGASYKNIVAFFGRGKSQKLVVGAHYDSHDDTPGADDNASAIAGLIELAYLLGQQEPAGEVELVAYTLEEPPFFGTSQMGSYRHAARMHNEMDKLKGVIVLEMIGFYSDQPQSQEYPVPLLKAYYPTRGDFIAVVGTLNQREFTRQIKVSMKGTTDLPVYSMNAPSVLPGIDFSDHRNYWALGINAVMVTDTAFYRNPNYHELTDTHDSLDYDRMSKVVIAVFEAIRSTLRDQAITSTRS